MRRQGTARRERLERAGSDRRRLRPLPLRAVDGRAARRSSSPGPKAGAPAGCPKRLLKDFSPSRSSRKRSSSRACGSSSTGWPSRPPGAVRRTAGSARRRALYFPHRAKDPDVVHRTALRSLRQTGYEDASLSALSISDYPHLEETVRSLMDELCPREDLAVPVLAPARGLSPRDRGEHPQGPQDGLHPRAGGRHGPAPRASSTRSSTTARSGTP